MTAIAKADPNQSSVAQVRTLDDLPLNRAIQSMEDKFAKALPAHIPAQRFVRTAISAVLKPEIEKVAATTIGRQSIYDGCLKAAADGLLLDGRESALVRYNTKINDSWVDVAQYMPMIAGILKKVRNSGEVDTVYCNAVYSKDSFKLSLVAEGIPVTHEPALADRGEFVGVYALARLKNGSWTQPEWMNKSQVDAIRERSKSGATLDRDGKTRKANGPWVTDYDEMARKTVLRRASKLWPSSTDKDGVDLLSKAWENDDDTSFETIEITPQPTKTPRKRSGAAAKALSAPPPADDATIEHDAQQPDQDGQAAQEDDV